MDTSLFYARLFGIYYVAMAVIWMIRGPVLARSLNEWTGNPGSMMLTGIMTLFIGAAMVASHQVYELSWRGVITVIAYIAVLKGAVLIGWPRVRNIDYTRFSRSPLRWITGLVCLVLGGWLAWIGFAGGA
ncbi:MAG: hypothetical protein HKN82_13875 [Akkermansiaceae bacterium]|nr:hypothetical protein [Akkermansiaceae bacterium]